MPPNEALLLVLGVVGLLGYVARALWVIRHEIDDGEETSDGGRN